MTFDVASIHETNPGAEMHLVGGGFTPHTTNLKLENIELSWLIEIAYGVDNYQISGQPAWAGRTTFTVQAKSDAAADQKMATLDQDQLKLEQQHMVQAFLAERFNLKTHWETKEGDVYNLVVAKGGPRLGAAGSMPLTAKEQKGFGDGPVSPIYQKNDGKGYDWIGHACPIGDLVSILTGMFGRPVIDKTGLTGKYDFVLKYKGNWDKDRSVDDMDPTPPLDRALLEELGFKVEAAKGPTKVLVIDHIERPSEN
jgi:uncharacterized protein (TIGR03435 family)